MTQTLRRSIALVAATLGFALPASATSFSIDYTDLWYNAPAESENGWGVNVIQQNEILFVTLFVYGADGTPRWFVGPATGPTGTNTFGGQLFTVTGSYYGAGWTGSNGTPVGNISFNFTSATSGVLSYTVNGVTVNKNIVRQTWRNENLTGHYVGGTVSVGPSCTSGVLISGFMNVTHNQPNITMTVNFATASGQQGQCNYSATYSQTGSQGAMSNGTYNCTINNVQNTIFGTFAVSEISTTRNGFNGRFTGSDNFCSQTGFFGGVKDVFQ